MTKKIHLRYTRLLAMVFMAAIPAFSLLAITDDYDDDIYFSPAKAKEQKAKEEARRAAKEAELYKRYQAEHPDVTAAAYSAGSSNPLQIDADAYNRNGNFLVGDGYAAADTAAADFAYTRRIERFYNPDVVSESGDSTLIQQYYYTQATQPTDVNIYVVGGLYDPMVNYSSWAWRFGLPSYMWGAYSPYYYGFGYYPGWYDWAFGWNWGWSWGWGGPAWYPGCPPHHPGHGPGWGGGHHHAWRPTSPGASSTHRPTYAGYGAGNRRPSTSSGLTRPGNSGRYNYENSYTPAGNLRPGNGGRGRGNISVSTNNAGNTNLYNQSTNSSSRPSVSGNNGSNSSRRGRSNYENSSSRSSNSSYRSSGNYSGGSRGSFGGGGGSRGSSGAGSGGRGRR